MPPTSTQSALQFAADKPQPPAGKSKRPDIVWTVDDEEIEGAIVGYRDFCEQIKALEIMRDHQKAIIKPIADAFYVEMLADLGEIPDGTMRLATVAGDSVTYVVQDRTDKHEVKEEDVEALDGLIDPGDVVGLYWVRREFAFDRDVMLERARHGTVQDVVDAALTEVFDRFKRNGLISASQRQRLIVCRATRSFRPGLVANLAKLCKRSSTLLGRLLDAVGGASVRFVKA